MRPLTVLARSACSLLAGITLAAAPATDPWSGDGGAPAFYAWGGSRPTRPGVMLRSQAAPDAVSLPHAARAERILYTSSDWRDPSRIITVSGIVFLPEGPVPAGGWPVIAWAHGTTGIADGCAPSLNPRSDRDKAYLGTWLAKGYAIVASDYQGLGTPGVHPYLQYRAEGISVLDGLRAAIAHFDTLSRTKIITMGQSQGSEGAIAAAYLAPRYAPELSIRGTVATGIVAHTFNIGHAPQVALPTIYPDASNYANTAYEALWFLGAARSIDPDRIRPADYLSKDGLKILDEARHMCMRDLVARARAQRIPIARFYKKSIDSLEREVDDKTAFPDAAIRTPIFIGTGAEDHDAVPAKQYNFASALCAAGATVEMHYYRGADHSAAVGRSLADSPAFVETVMAGGKPAGNCASLAPPSAGTGG